MPFLLNLAKITGYGLIAITVLCLFIPMQPMLPLTNSLDPSWVIGINQAVSQGTPFGQEMIFTFGPYASIYSKAYHPGTDTLMLLGSAYLGILYATALVWIMRSCPWLIQVGIWLVLSGLMFAMDTLFFSYALLIGLYCFGLVQSSSPQGHKKWIFLVLSFFLFSAFGLYPLIKGTLFVLYLGLAILAFCLFLLKKQWSQALIMPVSIASALTFFWIFSGQSIGNLLPYFKSTTEIISGYSEAMSSSGSPWEVASYSFVALALLLTILKKGGGALSNLFLICIFFLFLFVSFKSGFVRHDSHALICGTGIVFAALLLNTIYYSRLSQAVLLASCIVFIQIDSHYFPNLSNVVFKQIKLTYLSSWDGMTSHITNPKALEVQFQASLERLHEKTKLPLLKGSTDIYPHDQIDLIASGNTWNSRPILQSYSAYTSILSGKNRDHILGANAPENIFFNIEPLDERFPSLDGGASWSVLLRNYQPASMEAGFLLLKKRVAPNINPGEHIIARGSYELTHWVDLPELQSKLIFSRMSINLSLLGQLKNILFKPSPLGIGVRLKDGTVKYYRLVARMAQSEFLLSPLIENVNQFELLYQNPQALLGNQVSAFSIWAEGNPRDWQKTYTAVFTTPSD